jgi:hypothetical protein
MPSRGSPGGRPPAFDRDRYKQPWTRDLSGLLETEMLSLGIEGEWRMWELHRVEAAARAFTT